MNRISLVPRSWFLPGGCFELAKCKALVTAQGGKISAESAGKDQGATMVLTFEPAR